MSSTDEVVWRRPRATATVASILRDRAERTPHEVCLVLEGSGPMTCAELQERSRATAAALAGLGVGKGSSVASVLDNCAEGIHLWFACSMLGAVYVPINTAYRGPFLEHQLRACDAVLLATQSHRLHDLEAIEGAVADSLQTVLFVDTPEAPTMAKLRTASLQAISRGSLPDLPDEPAAEWAEPALVTFTSGTTGPSKGVVLSNQYLYRFAELWAGCLGVRPGDVVYSGLPMFHLSGTICTVLAPLLAGASGVLDSTFSVSKFWPRVNEVGATHTLLIGSMFQMLWQREPDADEASNTLRTLQAAPVPADLWAPAEERFGVQIVTGYGLSEAGPLALSTAGEVPPPGASGRPTELYEVIIAGEHDAPAAAGTVGEILLRSREPHVLFEGYFGNPEATARAWRNLWFHTGDLGRIDEDGYLSFVDRGKDYLRRRGENVSSFEVERALLWCESVAEAAVVGVASEMSEDDVKACVVLRPGCSISAEELLGHCIDTMPYFAVPRYIQFYDELPKSPVGRVLKYQLREAHPDPQAWDREAAGIQVTRTTAAERQRARAGAEAGGPS